MSTAEVYLFGTPVAFEGTPSNVKYDPTTAGATSETITYSGPLAENDTFMVGSTTYTYVGGADLKSDSSEVGFFASTGGKTYFFSLSDPPYKGTKDLVLNSSESYLCFLSGTLIATPAGEKPVESLAAGDLVMTADGRTEQVRWAGRQQAMTIFGDPQRKLPIRIKAGALGENLPVRDLLVSPSHAILVEDVLVQAAALVNGASVVREYDVPEMFTYYHIELERHSLLLAEGVPAESFLEMVAEMPFQNWEERTAPANVEELEYPRVKSARQLPAATAARLAQRAALFTAEAA